MAKKEVHERLFRFRIFYNVVTFIVFAILLIFDNDLKKSFQEFNYLYFESFFCLVGISYYLFYTAGKEPGYAVTYDKPREIEMEVASQKSSRSDSSLEVFENTGKENKMSLFNPTDPTSNNEYFSNDSDSDESLQNRSDLERSISKDIDSIRSSIHENAHPLLPDQRFCEICDIFQPYRTRHCQLCEKCISKYDHHCVWIGSCVGELNHGKFWLYLFFQNAVIIWTIVIIIDGIVQMFNPERTDAFNAEYQPLPAFEPYEATRYLLFMIFALVLSTTAFLFTGVLFFFHTYLIMTNQTTWEFARRKTISYLNAYPPKFHPFSKGLWENIKVVFFHKHKIRNWELPSPPPSQ